MPEAIMPQKRVLGDATNKDRNGFASPNAMKKRKLDNESGGLKPPSQKAFRKGFGSTQPQKSAFEEEVLEKMTQDINDLKQSNAEKDQQWERPPLGAFDPATENICFQQIDAEEGRMAGDKMAVRLFGVTEVISTFMPVVLPSYIVSNSSHRPANQFCFMSPDSNITFILPPPSASPRKIANPSKPSSRPNWHKMPQSSNAWRSHYGRISMGFRVTRRPGTSRLPLRTRNLLPDYVALWKPAVVL